MIKIELIYSSTREELTPEEDITSRLMTYPTRKFIKNTMHEIMVEKSNMDVEVPSYFLQQKYLAGQLSILAFLLVSDEDAKATLFPTDSQ